MGKRSCFNSFYHTFRRIVDYSHFSSCHCSAAAFGRTKPRRMTRRGCSLWVSRSVSRVLYSVIIYLGPLLPAGLKRPTIGKRRAAALHVPSWSCSRWGLQGRTVASTPVSSYLAFPPLPRRTEAVYLCCTILGVASTGGYPAPCSMELGLSSQPKPRDHLICSWNSLQETGSNVKGSCEFKGTVCRCKITCYDLIRINTKYVGFMETTVWEEILWKPWP